jgi:hypothetical protein
MKDLKAAVQSELEKIEAPYGHFVSSALAEAEAYQTENPNILIQLLAFLTRREKATASDVCEYMGYLIGLPYYDDVTEKWYRWDKEITEEEAKKIVSEKYSG